MRIQAAILMDNDDAGQLRYRFGSSIGADRPNEISLDAAVAFRRRHSFVSGLDAVVGARDLLASSIVGHQCGDDRGHRQAARDFLQAVDEGAAADLAVDEIVVKLYGS